MSKILDVSPMKHVGEIISEDTGVIGIIAAVMAAVPEEELDEATQGLVNLPLDKMRQKAREIIARYAQADLPFEENSSS